MDDSRDGMEEVEDVLASFPYLQNSGLAARHRHAGNKTSEVATEETIPGHQREMNDQKSAEHDYFQLERLQHRFKTESGEKKKQNVAYLLKGKLSHYIESKVKSLREVLIQPVDAEDCLVTGEYIHSYEVETRKKNHKMASSSCPPFEKDSFPDSNSDTVIKQEEMTTYTNRRRESVDSVGEKRQLSIAEIRAQVLGEEANSRAAEGSDDENKLFGIGENSSNENWYRSTMKNYSSSLAGKAEDMAPSPLYGGRYDPENPFAITSPSFHHSAAKAVMTTVQISNATVVNISITSIGSREKLIPKIVNSPAAKGGMISVLNPVDQAESKENQENVKADVSKITTETTSIMSKLKKSKAAEQNKNEPEDTELDHLDLSVTIEDDQFFMAEQEKRWTCKLCPKSYTTKHNLVTHILGHSDIRPHLCLLCKKYFKQLNHLNVHMLTHDQVKPHICSICNKAFTQISHLQRHQNTHEGVKSYKCDVCDESFVYKVELIVHKEMHDEPEKCAHCEKVFESAEALQDHMYAENHVTGITCKVCDKVFRLPSQMLTHLKSHFNGRPFTCKTCGLDFLKEKHLKFHELTHVGPKPHPCPQCGRLFNQKANMQRHMLIHNEQRAFKCEKCGKAFSQPQTLKAHQIVHADTKPHKCEICGKQFGRLHNLQGHMHTHSAKKPYSCSICQSTFTLKGNLNRHKKVKHGLDESTEVMEENAVNFLSTLSDRMRDASDNSFQTIDADSRDSLSSPESKSSRKGRKSIPRKHVALQPTSEDAGENESEYETETVDQESKVKGAEGEGVNSKYSQSSSPEGRKRKQAFTSRVDDFENDPGEKTDQAEVNESRAGRKRKKMNFGEDFIG